MIAADEVRKAAQAANLSDMPLHAIADSKTPVPLPEGAENVEFNGERGQTGIRLLLERNGAGDVLSRIHEGDGLEGTASG